MGNGIAHVTGQTWSYDFPGGSGRWDGDILIATFDASGNVVRSKGLGGPREDEGRGIAVDPNANIYVAGVTMSNEYFLGIPLGTWGGGATDGVFFKYDSTYSSASYFATYVGGNAEDEANGIAIDTVQALYVAGTTTSTNFPVTAGKAGADSDGFVARMHLRAPRRTK